MKSIAKLLACFSLACCANANASSVSYYLDQSNISTYPDGTNYLKITIDDEGAADAINFTVTTLVPALPSSAQMDQFGFNPDSGITLTSSNISGLPSGWSFAGSGNMDGFGGFLVRPDTNGNNYRVSSLSFSIVGISGDTINSYANLSSGNAGQVNQFFAAHVAGLPGATTSGFFAGSTLAPQIVPVPAAAWLLGSGLIGLVGFARRNTRR